MKLNDLKLNSTSGTELVRRNVEASPKVRSLGDVYDEHAKLVFLFDHSGSMSSQISRGYTDQYLWSDEKMAEIRNACAQAYIDLKAMKDSGDPFALLSVSATMIQLADWYDPINDRCKPDEELKELIVRYDLIDHFSVPINWQAHDRKPPTRLEVVKTLAKSEIERRVQKFPKSDIAVVRFNMSATVLFDGGDINLLWKAVDEMFPCGGTDILQAIKMGMECCRTRPSPIGVHHFILVTDGEDGVASRELPNWIPTLKASGMVLDYIHIGDTYRNEGLEQVCKATGGEFSNVNSEKELKDKFVEAVSRKCLPPAV